MTDTDQPKCTGRAGFCPVHRYHCHAPEEPVTVSVHGDRHLSPAARDALDALIGVATEQMRDDAPDLIRAPWMPEQVDALNRFQRFGGMHPFICGAEHPAHPNAVLTATTAGWQCFVTGCDYEQDWAHAFMADPDAWPKPFLSPLLARIRTAWANADDAADRFAELGMNPWRLQRIIDGEQPPNTTDLALIATACGVTVGWLAGGTAPRTSDRTETGPTIATVQVGSVMREDAAGDDCGCPDDWWASGEACHLQSCPRHRCDLCRNDPARCREAPPSGWDAPISVGITGATPNETGGSVGAAEESANSDGAPPCRTTRHCADHGFCNRCNPPLAEAARHVVKALRAAAIPDNEQGAVYARAMAAFNLGPSAFTWAESVASYGVGPTAVIDIDVHAPGHDEPVPVEIPLGQARVLYAMLGGVLDEHDPAGDGMRQRYADALRDSVILSAAEPNAEEQQVLSDLTDAAVAVRDAEMERLRWELRLAIAHDRQPYPTAWAYEQACKAREKHRERAEAALVQLAAVRALHSPSSFPNRDAPGVITYCVGCDEGTGSHPCPTIDALDAAPPTAPTVTITGHAATPADSVSRAQAIADHVAAEFGQETRLDVRVVGVAG